MITDLRGKRFGTLVVLNEEPMIRSYRRWKCRCDCGETVVVYDTNIKRGLTTRCRKCGFAATGASKRQHGRSHGYDKTYQTWLRMNRRCDNPSGKDKPCYGGRGIKVCKRWKSFTAFQRDVGDAPTPKHSIDRIDNNRGYEPGNVRWATPTEQANNKRNNRKVLFRGDRVAMSHAAKVTGLSYVKIRSLTAKHDCTVEQILAYTRSKTRRNQSFSRWMRGQL